MSGPSSMTARTSVTVGWTAGFRASSRSTARPRTTSSALVIRDSRTRVHSAISSDSRLLRTSQRSAWASAPLIRSQRLAQRAGVERVDPVQAAADADDLPAEVFGQQRVVGLGVAEDDGPGAGRDGSGDLSFGQGGFPGAGLAEDELAGVDDQAGAQPGQRVQADDLAEQLVPSDRCPHRRGPGAGDVREQAADLGGGGLILGCGRDVHGAAGVGNLQSPCGRDRNPGADGARRCHGAWVPDR